MESFLALACQLSPENLCCDGEISAVAAHQRRNELLRDWADLERRVGRKVSEDEVWTAGENKVGGRSCSRTLGGA